MREPMITTNIGLSDRLINFQRDTVKYKEIKQANRIYVAFDNVAAGRIRINGESI